MILSDKRRIERGGVGRRRIWTPLFGGGKKRKKAEFLDF